MSVLYVSVHAHLMVCPDGYEVQGRQRVKGGIADLMDRSRKVVAPKSNVSDKQVITNLSGIWRALIQIHNLSLVAREVTNHRQVVQFCNRYGLPRAIDSASSPTSTSELVSNVQFEADRMSKAIVDCKDDFVDLPSDVQAAFDKASSTGIRVQGRFTSLVLENVFVAGWFGLWNRPVNKSQGDWGDCDFCGGLKFARAGTRFCSDYCRDRNKKKIARAK